MVTQAPGDPRLAAAAEEPLSAAQLERALDAELNPVLSARRTAGPIAEALAALARNEQDFVLHWVEVIARTNIELAYQFASAAPTALGTLDRPAAEAWIIEAMDTYDRDGLHRGSQVLRDATARRYAVANASAVTFEAAAPVLELLICGLGGRRMRLDTHAEPHTDTETLFLPARLARCDTPQENFRLYKVLAALLWAQCRYGTFSADLDSATANYADPARARQVLNALETLRLEARIAATLPGLARDMAALRGEARPDPRCAVLLKPDATVHDSLRLLPGVYDDFPLDPPPYATALRLSDARSVRAARLEREKQELQAALARLLAEQQTAEQPPRTDDGEAQRVEARVADADDATGTTTVEIRLDGAPLPLPEDVARLLDSIAQDLGEIPDDYLVPADPGEGRRPPDDSALANDSANHWLGETPYRYPEWDYQRRHYRKHWCVLRELDVPPADAGFVSDTLMKYRPQVAQLKRTFELLRGEDRLLRREPRGDDIDLDAVIAAYADMTSGRELPERLFTRRQKAERDLAVMFMVDMSGSTKGWINDAEREALVMLCEALEVLGDRYAIYGFSGITRKRCEIFRVKRFDEPYSDAVRSRIAGIAPQDYTRMGVAIRHLTTLLGAVEARTKLLITLSDGKPDDYSDNYRGEYGIEDTRQALIEAHRSGVKPFCITIDSEARDYLPHLYGPVNWTLVDEVAQLPFKVADIYQRLTR